MRKSVMQTSKVQLKNYECHYIYEDFGNLQTIVFSNSLGADLSMWDEQVEALKHRYNILRYDTRGHGKSSSPTAAYKVEDLGKDVLELLNHLKLDKVVFCGLSMGGLIGQWLGIHHPNRFSHIVLANTAAKIGNKQGWNQRIQDVADNGLESILKGTAERWFTEEFRENQKETVNKVLGVFTTTDLQGYINCCTVVRDANFTHQLHRLNVPVLVISGLKDAVTTPNDGKYLEDKIPVASHFIIYAAHLSNVEQARLFSNYILFFTQEKH